MSNRSMNEDQVKRLDILMNRAHTKASNIKKEMSELSTNIDNTWEEIKNIRLSRD